MESQLTGVRLAAAAALVDIAYRRGISFGTVTLTVKMQDGQMVHDELETKEINRPN